MCHWQRWPHIAAAIIGIVGVALARDKARALAWTGDRAGATVGPDRALSERHAMGPAAGALLLQRPPLCLGSNMVPDVQCDVVTWQLFGLSLAAYNAIFSFLIAGLGGFALLKEKHAP